MTSERHGGVTYTEADDGYFARRKLKRHARIRSLWALGVGAVISGQFSGVIRVSVTITLLALAVLLVLIVSALPVADFSRWALNVGHAWPFVIYS